MGVVQGSVESILIHQRIMVSLFDDISIFHNENQISISNCGETMCDDNDVLPLVNLSIDSSIFSSVLVSTFDVASSKINNGAFLIIALAIVIN